jgi:hypothetical protein
VTAWWNGLSRTWRTVIGIAAAVVVVNLALTGLGSLLGNDPSGPPSSSYSTAGRGLAALSSLYGANQHPVDRLRRPLSRAELDPATTLVVTDPSTVLEGDIRAAARFVRAGGRLVAAGPTVLPLVQELVDPAIRWRPGGVDVASVLAPVAEAAGTSSVRADSDGSWTSVGRGLPFLGTRDRVIGLVADAGAGRVVALADSSILQNRRLGRADAAAMALAAAGDAGRRVVFEESSHGYGSGGAGVLPASWSRFLVMGLVAALLLMWSAARRLGPPEELARPLPPPRRAYVDALALSLSRTGEPAAAVSRLQQRGRRDLTRRLGLPADAARSEVAAAARRVGIPDEDLAALYGTPGSATDVIEVGRAAARHRGGRSD